MTGRLVLSRPVPQNLDLRPRCFQVPQTLRSTVRRLSDDMYDSASGLSGFPNAGSSHLQDSAELCITARFDSWEAIRKLGGGKRRFLTDDLRACGFKATHLSLINDIPARRETDKGRAKTTIDSHKRKLISGKLPFLTARSVGRPILSG